MSRWSSESVASSLHHRIFYAAIRLGGRGIAYCMLAFVALWYALHPGIRRRSAAYIRRRFPNAKLPARLYHAYRLTYAFGQTLVDRAALGILGDAEHHASDEDKDALIRLLAEGRGLILVNAHVGCWQTSIAALDFLDRPLTVVLHRADGDVDRHYFEHSESALKPGIIDPGGALGGTLEMLSVLRRGEVLCITGDRVLGSGKNTVLTNFMGAPVRLPISFYRIASLTETPIVVVFSRRVGPGKAEVRVVRVLRVPADLGPAPETYHPFASVFAGALEDYVRETPYQYFNFFDIWETRETK